MQCMILDQALHGSRTSTSVADTSREYTDGFSYVVSSYHLNTELLTKGTFLCKVNTDEEGDINVDYPPEYSRL